MNSTNTSTTTTSSSKLSKSSSNNNIANIVSLSSSSGSSSHSSSSAFSASVPTNKYFILDNYVDLSREAHSPAVDLPSTTPKKQLHPDTIQSLPTNVHNLSNNFDAMQVHDSQEDTTVEKAPIQKSYRDIKARYFTSLKMAQQKHQLQLQAHKDAVQTHFTMDEEAISPHFQGEEEDEEDFVPIPSGSGSSLLTKALKEEQRNSNKNNLLRVQKMRRDPSMDDVSGTFKEQKLSKLLSQNESYRKPSLIPTHTDTAESYMEGNQFLPPHLLAEKNRSDFSVYQQNKHRDLQKKAVMFEAL